MKVAVFVFAVLFVAVFTAGPAHAFENTLEHWHSLNATGRMQLVGATTPSSALYFLEMQPRVRLDDPRPEEVVFRAAVGWELVPHLAIFAGVGAIPEFEAPIWTIHETRLWQQIGFNQNIDRLNLGVRGRFEQRLFDDKDATLRVRAQMRAAYKLPVLDDKLSIIAWDEAFVVGDPARSGPYEAFDQNRGFLGAGYKFAPWFGVELGYLNVIKGDLTKEEGQMRHVIAMQTVVNLL